MTRLRNLNCETDRQLLQLDPQVFLLTSHLDLLSVLLFALV